MNGRCSTAVSAAGSTISDATDLTSTVSVVTTVSSGQGVQLPPMLVSDQVEVYNATTTPLKVYPDLATVAINQLAVGAAVTLNQYQGATFRKVSTTQLWANLSA
jgi:hypothetical protein